LLNANLRIYHPYGSLGVLPWQVRNNENSVPFGGSEYGDDLNLIADEIKTFNEQLEDDGLVKGTSIYRVNRGLADEIAVFRTVISI
jgi:hypothetical protein